MHQSPNKTTLFDLSQYSVNPDRATNTLGVQIRPDLFIPRIL